MRKKERLGSQVATKRSRAFMLQVIMLTLMKITKNASPGKTS